MYVVATDEYYSFEVVAIWSSCPPSFQLNLGSKKTNFGKYLKLQDLNLKMLLLSKFFFYGGSEILYRVCHEQELTASFS